MRVRSTAARLTLLALATLLIVACSSLLGFKWLGWNEIFGDEPSVAYWRLRFPRTLLAACVGAGLAIGGVIFQALFRNPLATPYTLGIASGASLAAAVGMFYSSRETSSSALPGLPLMAFAGAIAAMSLVYLMARLRAGRDMTRLLLAGVCVAYMSSAGIMLATYLSDGTVTKDIVMWLMGALDRVEPWASLQIALVLVPVLVFGVYSHRAMDLLAMGEDLAAARGVAVARTIWLSFGLVGVLTAVIVAKCGPIGFVGLMVPHFARALLGVRFLPLLLGSALLGAAFLAACDGVARAALGSNELPVGVVTNILGAAFFFYLLATRDISYASSR